MSYRRVRPHPKVLRGRPAYLPLGDTFTDMIDTKATDLEALAQTLTYDWKPTGFYKPADMQSIITRISGLVDKATAVIYDYLKLHYAHEKDEAMELASRCLQQFGKIGTAEAGKMSLVDAIHAAKSAGRYVDAPQFKAWVVKTLYECAYVARGYKLLMEDRNWAQRGMETVATIYRSVVSVIKTVSGVSWEVVKAAGSFAATIPDTVGTLYTVAKWGLLGYGIFWIATQVRQFRGG